MENQSVIQKGRFKCYICPANKSNNGRVIAVTTYKGRTVRGVAVCSLNDTFNTEYGCGIAIARCECKIADIRCKIAEDEYKKAVRDYIEVKLKKDKLYQRYCFALDEQAKTAETHDTILDSI